MYKNDKLNQVLRSIHQKIQTPWNCLILLEYFRAIEFVLNKAKISQIKNFAKIANNFLGRHFTETAWIVGPFGQAKRVF